MAVALQALRATTMQSPTVQNLQLEFSSLKKAFLSLESKYTSLEKNYDELRLSICTLKIHTICCCPSGILCKIHKSDYKELWHKYMIKENPPKLKRITLSEYSEYTRENRELYNHHDREVNNHQDQELDNQELYNHHDQELYNHHDQELYNHHDQELELRKPLIQIDPRDSKNTIFKKKKWNNRTIQKMNEPVVEKVEVEKVIEPVVEEPVV